eukprot:gnl/MRDRNA2_/MRDRNA2_212547_c0_seq1.p1 gnl/MRDRNA2_/MRDRNA2_212547_c0~~gnl/MRDRNA2_/MRDRNA2_212547_c0_seq1.p1  ORF type:complete len:363 (-),score=72.50 gnl/MRDRNA2_/MRDRNA2_212547_c0_seq1:5-1093(-)
MWLIGVGLEIVSTLSGTAGKQLVRFSEVQHEKGNEALSKKALFIGLGLNTAFGPIVDMAAYAFAAQSLIAPFGGLDVVWNTLFAPFTLKEKLTKRRALGCFFIAAGAVGSAFFGSHAEVTYTVEKLQGLFFRQRVAVYTGCFLIWTILNIVFLIPRPSGDLLRGLSLGMMGGTIAGNMFCVKATVELIKTSILSEPGEVWGHWLPYCVFAGAIFFAVSNVWFLTTGLREYEALFMVTVFEGSMIVANSLSGCIVLSELDNEPWTRTLGYGTCIAVVILGMMTLFHGETAQPEMRARHGGAAAESKIELASKDIHAQEHWVEVDVESGKKPDLEAIAQEIKTNEIELDVSPPEDVKPAVEALQ